MDINTMKQIAREKFKGSCRICPVCNGVACAGEMPGMGGCGTGNAFRNNFAALARVRLNLRTVHNVVEPKLACNILGMSLAMPVMAAPIAGINVNMKSALTEDEYAAAIAVGSVGAGVISMTGDGSYTDQFDCGLRALALVKGYGIPIIKPRVVEKVVEMAKRAEEAGAPAFGMDIDAAAFISMAKAGHPVSPKTQVELSEIKQKTSIPFIVKGIMTPDDAVACCEAGVDAIVVSNHGGRVLDYGPGTAEVLPDIASAVKGRMTVLVDGGIRSGIDILKMLALGADAVLIGRPLSIAAVGGGAEGVELVLRNYSSELKAAMILTGTADVAAVSRRIIFS